MLYDTMFLAVVAEDSKLMLVALDGFDEYSNLVDRIESIVKTNQTLRQEVDLLLAWHPQQCEFSGRIIPCGGAGALSFLPCGLGSLTLAKRWRASTV